MIIGKKIECEIYIIIYKYYIFMCIKCYIQLSKNIFLVMVEYILTLEKVFYLELNCDLFSIHISQSFVASIFI